MNQVQHTLMRAAMWLRVIKIAWAMDVLIQVTCTGGGIHGTVNYQGSILRDFLILWGISHGPLLVIPSLVTMSSHFFASSLRYSLNFFRSFKYMLWNIRFWHMELCNLPFSRLPLENKVLFIYLFIF